MDQKKLHRLRVRIGEHDDGAPIYKWVQGKTQDDLNDAIVQAYIASGRIYEFMDKVAALEPAVPETNFKEFAEEWFELYKANVKATTRKDYLYILERYLYPEFGEMNLRAITTNHIQALFNKWKTIAKSTINKMELTMYQVMSAAVSMGKIERNPVDKKLLHNPSNIVNERDALPEADYLDILENLPKLELSDRRLIALLALTGMRRGEVLGLKWEDIDFKECLIRVQRNVVFIENTPTIDTLKTKSGYRSIPLDERLVKFLEPARDIGFVIGGVDPVSKSSFNKTMKRINKTIDLHGATAHIFRHTYATLLYNAGVDIKVIQYIMGHADITTTMNIYTHTGEVNVKQAGATVSAKLDSCEKLPEKASE